MDSGNSGGSLQSSSGGGDEFNAACGGGADSSSTSSPLAALLRQQHFGGGASELIYGLQDLAGAPSLSSHWCSTTSPTAAPLPPAGAGPSPPPSIPCHGGGLASAADQTAAAPQQPSSAPPRGSSRKRARASRRAPTTVLTTDTSNFRAMVQEFTGIPAPPFAGAARSRLDSLLFPSRSSSAAAAAAAALPQCLLRPFVAHKLPGAYPPPSTSSPAPVNAGAPASASTAGVASGDGYQHHLTTAAPSALLGMQDHGGGGSYLSFQFQSALAGQLDGGKYPMFDRGVAPPSSAPRPPLPDPADFQGLAHGIVSPEAARNGDRGDELSGLVGGCKAAAAATTTTTATPLVAATAAMRTQGVDSWVCSTSE